MTRWFLAVIVMLCGACAGPLGIPRLRTVVPVAEGGLSSDAQCVSLLERKDTAGFWAKVAAGIGGAGALATAPDDIPAGGRWGIAAGAATLVTLGVALHWYADVKGDQFTQYCEVAAPSPTSTE